MAAAPPQARAQTHAAWARILEQRTADPGTHGWTCGEVGEEERIEKGDPCNGEMH